MDLAAEQACYVATCVLLAAVLNRRRHRGRLEGRQLSQSRPLSLEMDSLPIYNRIKSTEADKNGEK